MKKLTISRRHFVHAGGMAIVGSAFLPRLSAAPITTEKKLFSAIGIAAPLNKAAQLKAAGAEFLTVSVGAFLVPDQADEVFEKNLAELAASPTKPRAEPRFTRAVRSAKVAALRAISE